MTVPEFTVFPQGLGVVNADNLNSFVSNIDTVAALQVSGAALNGMVVVLQGFTSPGDGGGGLFWYNVTSTAPDDGGVTVIQPTGVTTGRWLRLPASSVSNPPITGPLLQIVGAGTTDLGTVNSHFIQITGTVTITSFGSSASTTAPLYFLQFGGGQTLTNSSKLQLPGAANITTAANDFAIAEYLGTGNWIVLLYNSFNGGALSSSLATIPQTLAGTATNLAVTPAGLAAALQTGSMVFAVDTSLGANTITLTLVPTLTAYVQGMTVSFLLRNTVTGATVININTLGNKTVTIGGSGVTNGALVANQIYIAQYDGTNFEIVSLTAQFSSGFTSSEIAISGSLVSVAHGLGAMPSRWSVSLRNKTAEFGYAPGQEYSLPSNVYVGGAGGSVTLSGIYADATSIYIAWTSFIGGSNIVIPHADGSTTGNVTAANWRFVFRAWL